MKPMTRQFTALLGAILAILLALGCAPISASFQNMSTLVQASATVAQKEAGDTRTADVESKTRVGANDAGSSSLLEDCPVTESVWYKPPEDSAVNDPPAFGYYYVNKDESIIASAWWTQDKYKDALRSGENGVKVGWFRPAGEELMITGERLDGNAPPLESHVPCCYPTRFQATGISFPTKGCWRVVARSGGSELEFVVWVGS